jgi:CheY-like chemotaxis protein
MVERPRTSEGSSNPREQRPECGSDAAQSADHGKESPASRLPLHWAQSEILANFSHELRTPMNAILGMLELSLDEQLDDPVRDFLATAYDSAEGLLLLLNNLLDYSRIESRVFGLDSAPFDIRDLIRTGVRASSRKARSNGLLFDCRVHEGVPQTLVGDARRVQQIVTILTANAVKFTESGQIIVDVGIRTRDEFTAEMLLVVSDTGIGIPAEEQGRIFEPFTQVDASATRKYPGAGLGLSIAAELAKQMNGHLWVDSQLGRGSRFFCALRLGLPVATEDGVDPASLASDVAALQSRAPGEPATESKPQPLHILVAEDTLANQKVVRALLTKHGHVVELAHNGLEALGLLRSRTFDVVLMDVQMPMMDGLQAAAAIRRLSEPHKAEIPIIAMTAQVMPEDRGKCLAAGMSDYLPKPINALELLRCVEQHAGREYLAADRGGSPALE